jgi:hypothetical protein
MITLVLHFLYTLLQVAGHGTPNILFGCSITRNYDWLLSTNNGNAFCQLAGHIAAVFLNPAVISALRSRFQICVAPTDTPSDSRRGPLVHIVGEVGLLSVAITTAMTIVHYSLYFI